jgi:ceramide glucosyltransferase
LRRLLPHLLEPGVGCLTCLPRGIRAHTIGARLIALHYTFTYLPQWMLAQKTTGIDWAIGHTMAVPRSVLERLDGFRGFLDHLADDYELGHRTSQLGLRVTVPPVLLDCSMPPENVRTAFRRLLRWKRTMRRARGFGFLGASLTYPLCWSLPLVLLHPAAPWAWATLLALVGLRFLLALRLQQDARLPDWRRSWWLLPLSEFLEGLSFLGAYTGNKIHWAGRPYRLRRDGTLRPLE